MSDPDALSIATDRLNAAIDAVEDAFDQRYRGASASVTFDHRGAQWTLARGKLGNRWVIYVCSNDMPNDRTELIAASRSLRMDASQHIDRLGVQLEHEWRTQAKDVDRQAAALERYARELSESP